MKPLKCKNVTCIKHASHFYSDIDFRLQTSYFHFLFRNFSIVPKYCLSPSKKVILTLLPFVCLKIVFVVIKVFVNHMGIYVDDNNAIQTVITMTCAYSYPWSINTLTSMTKVTNVVISYKSDFG